MKKLGLHLYSILVALAVLCLIVSGAMVANQDGASESWHRAIGGFVTVLVIGLGFWLAVTKTHESLRRLGRAAVAVTIADAGLGFLAGPVSAPASAARTGRSRSLARSTMRQPTASARSP